MMPNGISWICRAIGRSLKEVRVNDPKKAINTQIIHTAGYVLGRGLGLYWYI